MIAGVWAMLPFLLVLLAATLWETPGRVPTHWSSDLPDDFDSGAALFAVTASVAGFCAAAAALLTLLTPFLPSLWTRWLLALLATVAAGAAGVYGAAAWGTHVSGGAERVHVTWALAPLALAVLWGWVAYLLYRPDPVDREAVLETVPERARVVPTGGAAPTTWATRLDSGVMLATAGFVAVVLGLTSALSWSGSPLFGLAITLVSVVSIAFVLAWSRVEARVDGRGLTIRSTLVPVTLLRVPAGEVVGVETRDLDPMKWGGIGLRWLPSRTAYIVRGGPGLVIHRESGRPLGVEVTEGEEVAAAGARALLGSAGQAMSAGRSS